MAPESARLHAELALRARGLAGVEILVDADPVTCVLCDAVNEVQADHPFCADCGWPLPDQGGHAVEAVVRWAGRCRHEPVCVLGLGNRLETDEALGALVIEHLSGEPNCLGALPDAGCVDLIDGGTVGLALLPRLMDLDGLLVVDAINAGEEPGTLVDLDGASLIRHDLVMSVHDLGAGELLGALHVLEAWPRRVRVIGVEPKAIELGLELSEPVAAAMPGLLETIGRYLEEWQQQDL